MYNGALFDTSSPPSYPAGQTTDPRPRFRQLPSTLKASPTDFSALFQLSGEGPRDLPSLQTSSGPSPACGPAPLVLSRDSPLTFESEFHAIDDPAPLFHPTRHRDSVSSSSESSFSVPTSPVGLPLSASLRGYNKVSPEGVGNEEDGPWNLVAYQIPWGSAYEGYKAGTLPGPDGPCIFLRSPTPSKKQRTSQACEKCRERKAKCSGSRPACARCDARGYTCIYTTPTLGPHCREGSPHTSSPMDHSAQLPMNHPEHVLLHRTSLASISRKNSLPESESSASSSGTRERSPDVEDSLDVQQPYETAGTRPRTESFQSPSQATQPLVQMTPASSPVSPSPSGDINNQYPSFSSLFSGSTHDFSTSTVDTLSTDFRSGLETYRFPLPSSPLEDVGSLAPVHPQPQSLSSDCLPQILHPPSESGAVFGNEDWLCGVNNFWEERSLASRLEMGVEYSEPPSAPSTLARFPALSPEISAPRDFQPSCGMVYEVALLDPTFTGLAYENPYSIKDNYRARWTP